LAGPLPYNFLAPSLLTTQVDKLRHKRQKKRKEMNKVGYRRQAYNHVQPFVGLVALVKPKSKKIIKILNLILFN
jgi:hypothetical protein